MSYRPCVVRQRSHWGPWGAAGILPFTVTADGRAWVLLSHRSPHVQAGDSWSCFGGALDEDETPWQAAARETGEEIGGIAVDAAGILGEYLWECPERCGWSYRTYVVRVPPHSSGRLPRARVAAGAHTWETSELAWVPAGQVTAGRQLHPAFADAWPALRERIDASVRASAAPANTDEHALPKEMANMTGNDPAGSTPPGKEPTLSRQQEPDTSQPAEDPGYLTKTGEAAAEDGSIAPVIGGLPAVEGSAWDIGAPLDDRGADLADEQGSPPDQASHEDTGSS